MSAAPAAWALEAPRPQVLPLAEALRPVGARGRIGLVAPATDDPVAGFGRLLTLPLAENPGER